MIQANELRIGNWVKFINKVLQCGAGTIEDCQRANSVDSPFKYEPIPITPEILEKCGLLRDREGWIISYSFKIYDPLIIGGTGNYEQSDRKIYTILHKNSVFPTGFKYLHQLQNLYFALTGEELNFKL